MYCMYMCVGVSCSLIPRPVPDVYSLEKACKALAGVG